MLRLSALTITLLVTAALPGTAGAVLPTPASKTIVIGKGIGGVNLGASTGSALAAWGPGSTCSPETRAFDCTWMGTPPTGKAYFTLVEGKVVLVTILASPLGDGTYSYKGPLTALRTAKKIGIGSRRAAVLKAYPKAKVNGFSITIRQGKVNTSFATSGGRVYGIGISRTA